MRATGSILYLQDVSDEPAAAQLDSRRIGNFSGRRRVSFQAEGQNLSADIGIEFEFMAENEKQMVEMYRYFKREPQDIVQDFYAQGRAFFLQQSGRAHAG